LLLKRILAGFAFKNISAGFAFKNISAGFALQKYLGRIRPRINFW
jgi:hypothetical protein